MGMPSSFGDRHTRLVMLRRPMRMDLAKGGGREKCITIVDKKKCQMML